MADENAPLEVPPGEVPPENQIPPVAAPETVPSPPPAAKLVVEGVVKNERELQLEKKVTEAEERARRAEIVAAEKEREAQTLREIQSRPPEVPKPPKEKRKRNWSDPVYSDDETE